MSNVAIFRISVSLNMNFASVKDFQKLNGVWTKCTSEIALSDNPSQNTLGQNNEIE